VACEAATSPSMLLQCIFHALGLQHETAWNHFITLHEFLVCSGNLLIVLDNFETPWEESDDQTEVETILQRLTAIKHVSLMITMRGVVTPSGVTWTQPLKLKPLPPLHISAAKSAFLEMSGRVASDCGQDLDSLLEELDCIPLAVKLVAQLAKFQSCSMLLKQWEEQSTSLLHTRGARSGRLTSLEVSISLSLRSLRSEEEVMQLLSLLCYLPDGVLKWEEKMRGMMPGIEHVEYKAGILIKSALAYVDTQETLKVLSPIRHYMLQYFPASNDDIKMLENHYILLEQSKSTVPCDSRYSNAFVDILAESGNIINIFKHAMRTHSYKDIVVSAYNISEWMSTTNPSLDLIDEVILHLDKFGLASLKPKSIQLIGNILYQQSKFTEAIQKLEEAIEQFTSTDDKLGVAQCLQSSGVVYYMQSKYKEAEEKVQEGLVQFTLIGNELGQAQCLKTLAEILYLQFHHAEAVEKLTEAKAKFDLLGHKLGSVQCIKNMGKILNMQGKYTEAAERLEEAKGQFDIMCNTFEVGHCLKHLGKNFFWQGKYKEAAEKLKEAIKKCSSIGNLFGVFQCQQVLGDILCMEGNYSEAIDMLLKSKGQFDLIGNQLGSTLCLRGLGNTLYKQGKYMEATEKLEEARARFLVFGHSREVQHCLEILENISQEQGEDVAEM
jgi:tetratricopeptide (TPR) repeat protein